MADARLVKQKLRQLLQRVDFETETQRTITSRLEEELGVSLALHKQLIKEEIDAFLTQQQDDEDDVDEDFEPEVAPASKKQRAADGSAMPSRPAGSDFSLPLSKLRFVSVRQYGGRVMVDIREFYEQEGKLQPGRKGLSLQPAGWDSLSQHLGAVTAALEGAEEFCLELGSSKRATISAFKGRHSVDLREYYEKEGQMLPGKKGISLSAEEWSKLCEAAPQVSQQLAAKGGGAGAGAKAAAVPSGSGPGPASPRAPAAAAEASGVDLSSSRRADVSIYKKTVYINIREYYDKDGQKLPGKKGISLPREQFALLRQHAEELDAALKQRTTDYELQLSAKRKATISCFKGRYMVDIREYYEKGGQQLPGQKGISLPEDQWGKLMAGLPGLQTAVDAA